MFRVYDSGHVLREDILLRIQALRNEIAASERLVERLKVAAAGSEERIQKLKKEMGIIDLPKPRT